jgi:hypothetical protein
MSPTALFAVGSAMSDLPKSGFNFVNTSRGCAVCRAEGLLAFRQSSAQLPVWPGRCSEIAPPQARSGGKAPAAGHSFASAQDRLSPEAKGDG